MYNVRNIGRIVKYDYYYNKSSTYIDSTHSSEAGAYRRVAEIKETLSIMTELENDIIRD